MLLRLGVLDLKSCLKQKKLITLLSVKASSYCPGCRISQHHYQNVRNYSWKAYSRFLSSKQDSGISDAINQASQLDSPKQILDDRPIESVVVEIPRSAKKARPKIDWSQIYYKNSYITPVRALNEYLLKSSDLETLPKYTRRSPYPEGGMIKVFLKSDVEKKCTEKYGSHENFLKEKARQKEELDFRHEKFDRDFSDSINSSGADKNDKAMYAIKEALKQTREETKRAIAEGEDVVSVFKSGAGRVILYAILINAANFALKTVAWLYTGSHSMFSEAIHSAADTVNQVILAFGMNQSIKKPDRNHPYGYSNMSYVSSLISGVGIFCLGAGLSTYHGIMGLMHPEQAQSLFWAISILGGSFISEGATLIIAFNQAAATAHKEGISVWEYIRHGYEPGVNVILLEDFAAVLGVTVAASCMLVSHAVGTPFADALGSLIIGGILASVASFIIYTNTNALVGRAIQPYKTQSICSVLESDRLVRALHDVKATDMGGNFIRFKAEVDFDGEELTRLCLESEDLEKVLMELNKLQTIDEVEKFLIKHGASVIDRLGSEVDRLEQKIMRRFPQVRHVDLEIL